MNPSYITAQLKGSVLISPCYGVPFHHAMRMYCTLYACAVCAVQMHAYRGNVNNTAIAVAAQMPNQLLPLRVACAFFVCTQHNKRLIQSHIHNINII